MQNNSETLLKALTPATLRVYTYILKRNPHAVTLAELSQKLKLTKPTILHHTTKLERIELIEKTQQGYKVKKQVEVAVLKGYMRLFHGFLPTTIILMVFGFLLGSTILLAAPIETKVIICALSIIGLAIKLREVIEYLRYT